ncbi:transglycosylase domain-containing protein [Oceanobacillus sp. CAU 1775]
MAENKKSRTARRNQKEKGKKPVWKLILISLLSVGLLLGIIVGGVGIYWIATAPDLDPEKLSIPLTTQLIDKNGEVFATPGVENREKVNFEDLPDVLIDAVTATEDARFFEHPGIDLRRIGGAVIANITDGFGSQGASTITQQVVENFFLTNDKHLKLKVQEQWMALMLEREYTKQEIMEMYLNKIFYGNNSFGVVAAARDYFGVTNLEELTLPQAAILAGLPQRPTAYNPFQNPEYTAERMDTVLTLMVRHDKITQAQADEAREVDIPSLLVETKRDATPYEAFIEKVRDEIEEKLEGVDIGTAGLKVYTTLDPDVQEHVEFLLTDSESNPIPYGDANVQGSIVVLETETGAIEAIGGRRNHSGSGDFNYALSSSYQPGSTIKPIFDYGPAIEYNQMSTYHQINDDEPYKVPGVENPVRNVTQRYKGWVTARTALAESLNVPAMKVFEEVGAANAREFGTKLGLTIPENFGGTDAIGGASTNTSPLELAGAYRAFANGGNYNEPYAVISVEFQDGSSVDLRPEPEPVMKDYTAYMVTDMLKSVMTDPNGTWNIEGFGNLPVAGKTGTTNLSDGSAGDRWFAGYTTKHTITTWVGEHMNEDRTQRLGLPSSLPHTVTQHMFRQTLLEISEGLEVPDFTKPDSVVEVTVERGTNPPELASEYTPSEQRVTELFVKGTEPTAVSESFDELESVTGLTANYNENSQSIEVEWDYGDREVNFEVSASVDGGSMQELSTTDETSIEISEVEMGAAYTIQVIAVDATNDSLRSDPVTVSITVQEEEEEEIEEEEVEEETEEEIPAVSNLTAEFLPDANIIDVNWQYDGPPATYEVQVNNETNTVQSLGIEISGNFVAGRTYTITVTPIGRADGTRGSSQNATVTIPLEEEPDPEEEMDPEEDEE